MKTVKVLHVVNISFVLPYYLGEQIDYFKTRGVEFFVACSYSDHLLEYGKKKGVKVFPVEIIRRVNIFADLKAIIKLVRIIRKEGIEIVVGHTPKGGLTAMVAGYVCGSRERIYFRHGLMYETSAGIKRILLKMLERFTGYLATKVICVSNSVLLKSNKEGLSPDWKNAILHKGTCNGIDSRRRFNPLNFNNEEIDRLRRSLNIRDTDFVVGFVGRLVNDKGIGELLAAWRVLTEKIDDAKLLLIGPFEERDSLSEDLKSFVANEPSIIHLGLIPDVAAYYLLMDIFILPSYREGFPTVVLEASAMELPVITTRSTGCIDSIIDGATGVYVNISPMDICEKIEFYYKNRELIPQHGERGRDFVTKNFEHTIVWESLAREVYGLNEVVKLRSERF